MEPVPIDMPALEPLKRKPTINDVARLAGIGKATASRALSGNGSTSPATREAVLRAARELNFEVDPLARSLSRGRSHNLIGLFALNLDFGIGMQKIWGIQNVLGRAGYDVPLYAYPAVGFGTLAEQGKLLRSLCAQHPRAIIFKSGNLDEESLQALRDYQSEGGILVSYNHASSLECDQVIFDETAAMRQAVEYLYSLGHRHIGLRQHGTRDVACLTYKGFLQGLANCGLEFRPHWVWHEGTNELGGAKLAESFLNMPQSERPTAICVVNDISAAAFVGELARHGTSVPDAVSVVGFGDMPAAQHGFKPLTTVSEPAMNIVHHVARFLRERVEEDYSGPARRMVFEGEVVVRETTSPQLH